MKQKFDLDIGRADVDKQISRNIKTERDGLESKLDKLLKSLGYVDDGTTKPMKFLKHMIQFHIVPQNSCALEKRQRKI